MLPMHSLTKFTLQLFAEVTYEYTVNECFSLKSYKIVTYMNATIMYSAAYTKALEDALSVLDKIAMPIDAQDRKSIAKFLPLCYKFCSSQ